MLGPITRLVFAATAVAPMLFVYAAVILVGNRRQIDRCFYILLIVAVIFVVLCWGMIWWRTRSSSSKTVKAISIENAGHETIGLLLAYTLPIVTGETLLLPLLGVLVLLVTGMLYLTDAMHVNPLLRIIGYRSSVLSIKNGATIILLTKRSYRDVNSIKRVVYLTETLAVDVSNAKEK